MRSTFTRSIPAVRAYAIARSTLAGSWVRPSARRTLGTIDCTPKLKRFTPARAYDTSLRSSTPLMLLGCAPKREISSALRRLHLKRAQHVLDLS